MLLKDWVKQMLDSGVFDSVGEVHSVAIVARGPHPVDSVEDATALHVIAGPQPIHSYQTFGMFVDAHKQVMQMMFESGLKCDCPECLVKEVVERVGIKPH